MSRRGLFWVGVGAAVVVTLSGTVLAVTGYLTSAGPGRVVRDYFAALSRGDAQAALAYGAVPDGPRELLTGPVLRAQQKAGRLGSVSVVAVDRRADSASVSVHYTVAFGSGSSIVDDRVTVRRQGRSWRLAQAAVPVDLTLPVAQRRATVAGAPIPSGRPLVFPGAAPVTFDTPTLQLAEPGRVVRFADPAETELEVTVSPEGHRIVATAVAAALQSCLSAPSPDPLCPLPPGSRVVPGTVRGTPTGAVANALSVTVGAGADGRLDVSGQVPVTGRYTQLTFDNQPTTKQLNRYPIRVRAHASAVAPQRIVWDTP
jgi:hypothetical protein